MPTSKTVDLRVYAVQRSKGESAVAEAAMYSATALHDRCCHHVYDCRHLASEVVFSEVLLPACAPGELSSREELWNAVEKHETRKNAQLARVVYAGLPVELDRDGNTALAREFAESLRDEGMCVDLSVHYPAGEPGKSAKPYAVMMCAMRPLEADGSFGAKILPRYVCRHPDDIERVLSGEQFKAMKTVGWEKVYSYGDGRQLTKSEARKAGLDPIKDRVRPTPVVADNTTTDWSHPEKWDIWRERYAEMMASHLRAFGFFEEPHALHRLRKGAYAGHVVPITFPSSPKVFRGITVEKRMEITQGVEEANAAISEINALIDDLEADGALSSSEQAELIGYLHRIGNEYHELWPLRFNDPVGKAHAACEQVRRTADSYGEIRRLVAMLQSS